MIAILLIEASLIVTERNEFKHNFLFFVLLPDSDVGSEVGSDCGSVFGSGSLDGRLVLSSGAEK